MGPWAAQPYPSSLSLISPSGTMRFMMNRSTDRASAGLVWHSGSACWAKSRLLSIWPHM